MYCEHFADTKWRQETETQSRVDLSLDLQANDILVNRFGQFNVFELMRKREEIRKELFRQVVEEILPQIFTDAGISPNMPEGELNTAVEADNNCAVLPEVRNGSLSARSKMNVVLELQADRAVDPLTALYASRGVLAASIADSFVHSLEQKYLGKRSMDVGFRYELDGDRVVDYASDPARKV